MVAEDTQTNQGKWPSPFAYFRKLRPQYFSDTVVRYEVPLTQELFDLQLALLSTKKMQSVFENFIVAIAKRNITPNIKPQTGPDGGGDGKVDAETYEVSNDISDKWYSVEDTANGKEYWAFAISCKKQWKPKLISDVAKIVATNRGYTKALFFSNQYVKSSTRANVEEDLSKQYGIVVKVYDANVLSKWVFQDGGIEIALSTLGFSDEYKQKTEIVGPNDKVRREKLTRIEQSILRHVEGLDTQYVDDLHEACILSRGLGESRTTIEGLFQRAIRECNKHGSQQQLYNIVYDHAWTSFFWFDDVDATYNDYLVLKSLIEEHCNVTRIEKATNLLTNLINAARGEFFDSKLLIPEFQYIKDLQKKLDDNPDKRSSALYLAIYIQEQKLIDCLIHNKPFEEELLAIKPLLLESAAHLEISIESHFRVIEMLSGFIEDNEQFEELIDELAEIIADKRSKAEAARVRLSRAETHMEKGRWSAAIKQLGFCVYAFEQESCMTELVKSSGYMGSALNNLGLPYSAEAYLVKAASFLIQDFYHSGIVPHLLITVLHELCGIELKLGRIVMYLNWYELLSVVSNNAQFNEEESYKTNCALDDAAWVCRFAVSNLKDAYIAKLPDVLDRMCMFNSSEYLKYALGYPEDVDDSCIATIKEIADSPKLREQPVFSQFLDKLNISIEGEAYAKTTVNNFTITIYYKNDPKVQRIAELFLASIESFMATSELFEIMPVNDQILIIVTQTNDKSDLQYRKESNDYELRLNPAIFDDKIWWNCLVKLIAYMLSNNAVTREPLEAMIEKKQHGERLMDRISVLQRTEMALNNVLGQTYKYRLEDWCHDSDKIYTYRGKADSFENKSFSNIQQSTVATYTINSNMTLWNDAGWRGCFFMIDQQFQNPAIFGLSFLNIDNGRKIVAEWKSKYSVTVYIIKGINSQHPTWYRVCIAPNVNIENQSIGRYYTTMCRSHTMTPDTNENLNRFEYQYRRFGGCWLMAVATKEDNSFDMPSSFDSAFKFTNVVIRDAYQIDSSDPARVALRPDDAPYIPDDRTEDAPVLKVLEEMKGIIRNK